MDVALLDTDVFSYLNKRGHKIGALYAPHVQGKSIAITFVTKGEIYAGIEKRKLDPTAQSALEHRLKQIAIIPYDDEICKIYGRLRATLKTPSGTDRGHPSNDLWIAACAIRHGLTLITHNRKDFENIPGLKIISEPPPKPDSPPAQTGNLFDPKSGKPAP